MSDKLTLNNTDWRDHDESDAALEAGIGRLVECARVHENALCIVFADGSMLRIEDCGQDCCEHRYMTCDDDLNQVTGRKIVGAEVAGAPNVSDAEDVHEIQFLRVKLDDGSVITCETHNEHNGYYGGFNVQARFVSGQ